MSMFANEFTTDAANMLPICPLCKGLIEPGTSEACTTPTGLWIIHKPCIENYNARNTPGAEWT